MITAVSLNPSIDMTLSINEFIVGGLNRVLTERYDAGGKGMNVTKALSRLGAKAECVGFVHRETAALFENSLKEANAGYDFVYCEGRSRTNIKVFDTLAERITEINQSGREVTSSEIDAVMSVIKKHAETSKYMILSGSLPPKCPVSFYRDIILEANRRGCKCVLDADGDRLKSAIQASPHIVKPNKFELETLLGVSLTDTQSIINAAKDLTLSGVGIVAVSLGSEGAIITDAHSAYMTPGMKIDVKSTVGAGDSMVAGLTAALYEGKSLSEAFKTGIACSLAACETEGTGVFSYEKYTQMYDKVEIREC